MALAGYGDMVSQDGLAPCTDCTGSLAGADGSGDVEGDLHASTPTPLVSQHAANTGGAGTYDDGTCWGEPAPERRRVHPLSVLGALLALAWVALMLAAAVVAIESMTNALRGK